MDEISGDGVEMVWRLRGDGVEIAWRLVEIAHLPLEEDKQGAKGKEDGRQFKWGCGPSAGSDGAGELTSGDRDDGVACHVSPSHQVGHVSLDWATCHVIGHAKAKPSRRVK